MASWLPDPCTGCFGPAASMEGKAGLGVWTHVSSSLFGHHVSKPHSACLCVCECLCWMTSAKAVASLFPGKKGNIPRDCGWGTWLGGLQSNKVTSQLVPRPTASPTRARGWWPTGRLWLGAPASIPRLSLVLCCHKEEGGDDHMARYSQGHLGLT